NAAQRLERRRHGFLAGDEVEELPEHQQPQQQQDVVGAARPHTRRQRACRRRSAACSSELMMTTRPRMNSSMPYIVWFSKLLYENAMRRPIPAVARMNSPAMTPITE